MTAKVDPHFITKLIHVIMNYKVGYCDREDKSASTLALYVDKELIQILVHEHEYFWNNF